MKHSWAEHIIFQLEAAVIRDNIHYTHHFSKQNNVSSHVTSSETQYAVSDFLPREIGKSSVQSIRLFVTLKYRDYMLEYFKNNFTLG